MAPTHFFLFFGSLVSSLGLSTFLPSWSHGILLMLFLVPFLLDALSQPSLAAPGF